MRWTFVLVAASFLLSLFIYPFVPATVPIHWNIAGQADGFASRDIGLFLLPAISAVVFLVIEKLHEIDPIVNEEKKASLGTVLGEVSFGACAFFFALNAVILSSYLGKGTDVASWAMFLSGFFMGYLGFVLPRVPRNYFCGIRTPWSLSSDRVWKRTHDLGGKTFIATGAVMALYALVAKESIGFLLGILLVGALVPIAYSYFCWKAEAGGCPGKGGKAKKKRKKAR